MPWSPMAPPTSFSNLPQIIPPQQQAPDTGTQLNSLATGAAQRQLMGQQTQDAATQNQANQIAVQQAQMDLQDQQKWRQIYQQSNGDMGQALQSARQAGVGPRTLMPIQTMIQTYQTGQAKLTQDQLEVQASQNDGMHQLVGPVQKITDPTAQKAAWDQMNQDGVKAGYQTPAHAAANPYPGGPDGVTNYALGLGTVKWMTADAAQKRSAAQQTTADTAKTREDAEAPGQQADAAQKTKALAASDLSSTTDPAAYDARRDKFIGAGGSAGVFPPSRAVYDPSGQWLPGQQAIVNRSGMTTEQKTLADQAASKEPPQPTEAGLAAIATDPTRAQPDRDAASAALKRLDQSKIAARPVNVNNIAVPGMPAASADGPHGAEYLATIPAAIQGTVKAIAEGRESLPSGFALSKPYWQSITTALHEYDPQWSEQRAQIRKGFTMGASATNIGNLNTATVHLDALADLAKAMDNGPVQPGNEIWNRAATMFGGSAPTNYEGLRQAVAGEMDAALHGTSTIEGRQAIAATMPAKAAPGQMSGIIDTNLHTLSQKLGIYSSRYRQAIPGDTVYSPVLPGAQAVFAKHGVSAPGGQSPNPSGGGKVADAGVITKYLQSNGNDKAKARAALAKDGYSIPQAQ